MVADAPLPDGMGMPMNISGRIFAPARFVADAFGATVSWESATRTVVIYG
jgi:hypothetical protein